MRTGNFTSSEIAALMKNGKVKGTFGEPALTYIEECNMERRLGRQLENETNSKETTWGNMVEGHVFDLLSLEYSTISKQTIVHPNYDFWSGTPDSICYGQENTVVDIKSPFTLKSFCQLVDSWERGGITAVRETHKQGEKYYWQIVSNACLTGCNWGELIVYVPFKSELDAIRKLADFIEGNSKWILYTIDNDIPWLPDRGHYKNLNKFRFPVPEADKTALTNRVAEAGKMLVQPKLIEA
jgi:hypothetical protein